MKKIKLFILLFVIVLLNKAKAQSKNDYGPLTKNPVFYIGVGAGLNNNCGLTGLKLGVRLSDRLLLDASAGLGSWGSKVGLGIVFNAVNTNAWCPVISISRATGLDEVPLNLEVQNIYGITGTTEVKMKCNPATLFNISVQRQWIRKKGNRLVFEMGYSILLDGASYELLDNRYTLTTRSKSVMNVLKPGGLMLAFSYNFGVH